MRTKGEKMQEPTKIINEIREILFKYLDIQKVPDIMNDIRTLFNEPDKVSIPVELPVKPANAEKEIFEYIEELLAGDICDREDAIKNGCGRCRDYWNYRDKRLSV
jgi:hypothetical protein